MAPTCKSCGAEIDEKTFCLSEDMVLAEIQAARDRKAAEEAAKVRSVNLGKSLLLVGVAVAAGSGLVAHPNLALGTLVVGLATAGAGLGIWWPFKKD